MILYKSKEAIVTWSEWEDKQGSWSGCGGIKFSVGTTNKHGKNVVVKVNRYVSNNTLDDGFYIRTIIGVSKPAKNHKAFKAKLGSIHSLMTYIQKLTKINDEQMEEILSALNQRMMIKMI